MSDTMRQMYPSDRSFDWSRSLSIFCFIYGVVHFRRNDHLFMDYGVFHTFGIGNSDSSPLSSFDKRILRARVQSIPSFHKLRVKHHVSLLRRIGLKIRQPLPIYEILCPYNATLGNGSRLVSFGCMGISTFCTKQAVYPTILMRNQPHIVDIGIRYISLGQLYRFVPKPESVDATRAFSNGKERLSVYALYPGHDNKRIVPFYGSGIEHSIHPYTLHEIGIAFRIQIIAPMKRNMRRCQNRTYISVIYPIAQRLLFISLSLDKTVILCSQCF